MSRLVQIIILGLTVLCAVNGQRSSCGVCTAEGQAWCCPSDSRSPSTPRPPIKIQIEGLNNNQEPIYRPPPQPPRERPLPYYPVLGRDYPRYSPMPMPKPMPMSMSIPMPMPVPVPVPVPVHVPMPNAKSLPPRSSLINPIDDYEDGYYMVPITATRKVIKKKKKEENKD